MTAAALVGCAWGVAAAAWWLRATGGPQPRGLTRRLNRLQPARSAGVGPRLPSRLAPGLVADRVGGVAARCLAAGLGRPLALAPAARQRAGWAVLAGAVGALVVPWGAPGAGLATWCAIGWARRRAAGRRAEAVLAALPEAVDLVVLGVEAGANVPIALAALARRGPEPIASEVGRALGEAGRGRRLADALEDLPARLGEGVRPLVAALVASDRYGAPLADGLARLAADVRGLRRRRAEEAARRVPVKLLFPLVTCTLPAFALLTVAPLLAGALGALGH